MSEKIDKKEKISGGDPNAQHNDDNKNDADQRDTQTNIEKTDKEDATKEKNGENNNKDHSDKHKNGKKSSRNQSAKQKKDSKTDKDQNAKQKKDSKTDKDQNAKQKKDSKTDKDQNAKQKKDSKTDKDQNPKQKKDSKTDKDQNAKQKKDSKTDKDQNAKQKKDSKTDKDQNAKQKKDSKTDMDQSTKQKNGEKGCEKQNAKEKNGKNNGKSHKAKHKKSRTVTFDDEVQQSPLSGGFAKKVQDVAGLLKRNASDIRRKKPIDWNQYREDNAITEEEFSFINTLQYANTKDERDGLLQNSKEDAYHAIAKILDCVHSVEEMQILLVLIHDFLAEDFTRVELMNKATPKARDSFQHLLTCSDDIIRHTASQVLTKLLFAHNGRPEAEDIQFFLAWLKEGLDEYNPYLQSVARCLQKLLQVDDYRLAFVEMDGIHKIIRLLTRHLKTQIQYQLCFCLWVSTFNAVIAAKMNSTNTIPIVMDLVERCPSEITKLPRVAIALIRNLLEKPQSAEVRRHNALLSIQCQILQYLELLEPKIKIINDLEFSEDFEEIRNILSTTVMEASSFEEYMTEVKSGRLIWSVVHTSQNFWVDNAERFNDNDHELLKMLISFLEESEDSVVLCIAAHDLGEYMKQYIRGKTMVEKLGGKGALIKLLECTNQQVKYQALKCLQMLMLDKHDLYSEFQTNNRKIAEMCCIMDE